MSFFGVPEVESKTHAVRMGESSAIVALPCATHGVRGGGVKGLSARQRDGRTGMKVQLVYCVHAQPVLRSALS